MTAKTLSRSSLFFVLSGILLLLGIVFHPDMAQPDYAARSVWVPVHIVLGVSALFGLFALAGLFGVMHLNLGAFGRTAFVLAMLGNVLLIGVMFFVEASVLPVLARDPAYQSLMNPAGPLLAGGLGISIAISMAIAAVGYLLLAWYLASTRTISPVNAILFIGAPLLVFAPPLPHVIGVIGGLLLASAIIWLGYSIRAGVAHRSLVLSIRVQDECLAHKGHA